MLFLCVSVAYGTAAPPPGPPPPGRLIIGMCTGIYAWGSGDYSSMHLLESAAREAGARELSQGICVGQFLVFHQILKTFCYIFSVMICAILWKTVHFGFFFVKNRVTLCNFCAMHEFFLFFNLCSKILKTNTEFF